LIFDLKKILVLWLLACSSASAANLPRDSRVPGGVALVPVGAAGTIAPMVSHAGNRVWVARGNDNAWVAVVGLPIATAPGAHTIAVSRDGSTSSVSFTVRGKKYPVQKLTLNKAMVDPPKEVMQRIERESAHLAKVRAHWREADDANADLLLPAAGRLSSRYGVARVLNGKPRAPHVGLDVAVPTGTPLLAPADSIVLDVGDYYFCGKTLFLDHGNGLHTLYCHLSEHGVQVGDVVKRGQTVGLSGATGRATGPHLHWSVYLNGVSVDPELFLPPEKTQ
jgi:murein DD-endopeptidase MepM/ murein hydrolase activator NlpD